MGARKDVKPRGEGVEQPDEPDGVLLNDVEDDDPDLLKEFTYFLPDQVQEQAKKQLQELVAKTLVHWPLSSSFPSSSTSPSSTTTTTTTTATMTTTATSRSTQAITEPSEKRIADVAAEIFGGLSSEDKAKVTVKNFLQTVWDRLGVSDTLGERMRIKAIVKPLLMKLLAEEQAALAAKKREEEERKVMEEEDEREGGTAMTGTPTAIPQPAHSPLTPYQQHYAGALALSRNPRGL